MSLPHFYLSRQSLTEDLPAIFRLDLSDEDLHHAMVLRLSPGEHLAIVDADKNYFEVELRALSKDGCEVRIANRLEKPLDGPSVTLLQGIAKGEKMDFILRHATEIGVKQFIPFFSSRGQVKLDELKAKKRTLRWQKIVQSAAQQSGQIDIPQVYEPRALSCIVPSLSQFDIVLICWEEAKLFQTINMVLNNFKQNGINLESSSFAVVVGPEGGLSHDEVELLMSHDRAALVCLGPSILRTETAGLIAPALLIYELSVHSQR